MHHTSALQGYNPTIFNNDHFTTNIPTYPHTVTTTDIKQKCAIYIDILSLSISPQESITKYCTSLYHTIAALKRYFPAAFVAPLPNPEQINYPLSNHTYPNSTPNHIHHHYALFVALT